MAYGELVSFIREQLKAGRDAITIRQYLIKRGIHAEDVDEAFDVIYGNQGTNQTHHENGLIQKTVVVGFIILVLAFAGIGVKFYMAIPGTTGPVTQIPGQIPGGVDIDNEPVSMDVICDFEDTDDKYECYIEKIENQEIQCHQIDNPDEKKFCYSARDLYLLGA